MNKAIILNWFQSVIKLNGRLINGSNTMLKYEFEALTN